GKTDLYEVVHRMIHKDGSDSWVYDRGRIVEYGSDGEPLRMMGTHIDITKEKRYEQQLAKLASSDPLTGLLNRKAIEENFNHQPQTEPSQQSALVFVDIDNFKAVND
ncbi:diguanylate cyclase, partial [Vibrio parahaemolyticus]